MRAAVLLPLLALLAGAHAVSFAESITEEFRAFKLEHRKHYKGETEESFRLKIFNENKHKIAKHNQQFAKGKVSFKLAVNKYADMLHHEFRQLMNGFNYTLQKELRAADESFKGVTFISPAHVTLPKSVDWRTKGAVT
uniref:Cathepsin L-like n=1 Tax=Drosophila rhopaloa TaxID=1041015 RepID=A0A6P4EMV6_DRORH